MRPWIILALGFSGLASAGSGEPHRVKLAGYFPSGTASSGLVVYTSVNHSKPLRLLFDTGARGLVLNGGAARKLGLRRIAGTTLVGFGSGEPGSGYRALAESVKVGDLEFRDLAVTVAAGRIAPGADGVVGANVFSDYIIRIDPNALTLDLLPYSDDAPAGVPAIASGDLLFVKARVNRGAEGVFLVDTGSAVSSLSPDVGRGMAQVSSPVAIGGAQGLVSRALRVAPVRLDLAGRTLVDPYAVALDLNQLSRRHGVKLSGVIGYSALARAPFTINYRDGLIDFGR